jgi:hypothetical protein
MKMHEKQLIKRKECYKYLHHYKSDENIQKYKEDIKNAKKTVSKVRSQVYKELYQKLDTNEEKNDVYNKAKLRERKVRDFNQVKYIKDESNRFLIKDEEIKNRRRKYFNKLFNEEGKKIMIKFDD